MSSNDQVLRQPQLEVMGITVQDKCRVSAKALTNCVQKREDIAMIYARPQLETVLASVQDLIHIHTRTILCGLGDTTYD